MIDLTLSIDLPAGTVDNQRTRLVACDFEMDHPMADRLRVLAPTTVRLTSGELVYLVGASGSGKSQVLRAIARAWPGPAVLGTLGEEPPQLNARRHRTPRTCKQQTAVLDALGLPVEPTLRLLCLAGLAEPRLWLSPATCLSAGQADRLELARLFAAAESAGTAPRPQLRRGEGERGQCTLLAIDEFGSRLDRLTARVLARNLRRWLDRAGDAIAIVATAHDDLLAALEPDQVWVKNCESGLAVRHPGSTKCFRLTPAPHPGPLPREREK